MVHNFPINPEDSVIADHIYRPARPLFQGGMKCRRNPSENIQIILLPTDISLHHKNNEL